MRGLSKKIWKKRMERKGAFALIELMVVLLIASIMLAVAAPNISKRLLDDMKAHSMWNFMADMVSITRQNYNVGIKVPQGREISAKTLIFSGEEDKVPLIIKTEIPEGSDVHIVDFFNAKSVATPVAYIDSYGVFHPTLRELCEREGGTWNGERCLTQGDSCAYLGKYWYNNTCNDEPEIVDYTQSGIAVGEKESSTPQEMGCLINYVFNVTYGQVYITEPNLTIDVEDVVYNSKSETGYSLNASVLSNSCEDDPGMNVNWSVTGNVYASQLMQE